MSDQISTLETSDPESQSPSDVYNASLWFAFLANVFQLISLSLLFRYSDFVKQMGGTEFDLGLIVGVATVGAIFFRLVQGAAIDWIGPKAIWIASLLMQLGALIWHLELQSVTGIEVYLTRGLYAMGLAGSFGAWLSFISLQAPVERIAEVIGVVGSSGFVGMAIGPVIGDAIFTELQVTRSQIESMFHYASLSLGIALLFALCATFSAQRLRHGAQVKRKNPLPIIWHQWPGFILVVGMMMGLAIAFAHTYLRPLAESLEIIQIQTFFLIYNITAFIARLLFRRAPQLLGLKFTITVGFSFFFLAMLLFMFIESERGFILPAALGGLGHSFLFPSVIAACTNRFRREDRGVATNLILAMYDAGVFFGMPLVGKILTEAPKFGYAAYPSALTALCTMIAAVSLIYLLTGKD